MAVTAIDIESLSLPRDSAVGARPQTKSRSRSIASILVSLVRVVGPISLIVFVSGHVVSARVSSYRHIDALDEQAHVDYVIRMQQGAPPAFGHTLLAATLLIVDCRGIETPVGFGDTSDCSTPHTEYPQEAASYEAGQPLGYYAVTAWFSQRVAVDDPLDAMRLVGIGWLAVGSMAVFGALRIFGVRPMLSMAGALAGTLAPGVQHAASTVSNDIAVWTFGGVALLVAALIFTADRVRWFHAVMAAVLGIAAGLTKPTCLMVVVALAIALAVRTIHTLLASRRITRYAFAYVGLAAMLCSSTLVASALWARSTRERELQPIETVLPFRTFVTDTFDPATMWPDLLYSTNPITPQFTPQQWRGNLALDRLLQLAGLVLIAIALLPILAWRSLRSSPLAIGLVVALAISGPFYAMVYFLTTHQRGWTAQPRFAMGLLPLVLLGACTWPTMRWQRWLTIAALAAPGVFMAHIVLG